LKKVKSSRPDIEFIFLSGQSKIEVAVEAIKLGAFDYIVKDNFARENTYHKICNLLKMKKLSIERKAYKFGLFLFACLFTLSVLSIFIFFVGK
jgi:DNA-binding NtrC family response regulator